MARRRQSERERLKLTILKLIVNEGTLNQKQVSRRLDAPFDLVTELMAELEDEGRIVKAPKTSRKEREQTTPLAPPAAAPPPPAADPMAALRNLWEVACPKYTLTVLHLVEKWKAAHAEDRDFRAGIVVGFISGISETFGAAVLPWWYGEVGKYGAWREFFDQAVRHRWPEAAPPPPGAAPPAGGIP